MNTKHEKTTGWLNGSKIVFTIFGLIFLFMMVLLAARQLRLVKLNAYLQEPWFEILLVYLIALAFLQLIILTLRKGRSPYTIILSSVYVLLAVVAIVYVTGMYKQLEISVEQLNYLNHRNITLQNNVTSLNDVILDLVKIIKNVDPDLLPAYEILTASPPTVSVDQTSNTTDKIILYVTAITGLVTAISGLYGQVLSARKLKYEIELAQLQAKTPRKDTSKAVKPKRLKEVRKNK